MIPDASALHVDIFVNGERYTAYCVEEFRKDEIPCSYTCKGEYPGKIRQIKQIRARDITGEEISPERDLWKTIKYGARHKLGHGRGLCERCKKNGITAESTPSPQRPFRRETSS